MNEATHRPMLILRNWPLKTSELRTVTGASPRSRASTARR